MKVKITNFGPIKEVELDLSKDLTMIYGKNNTGKSYAISLVYLLLNALSNNALVSEIIIDSIPEKPSRIISTLIEEEKDRDFTKVFEDIIKQILKRRLVPLLSDAFYRTFGNPGGFHNGKSRERPNIQLSIAGHMISISIGESLLVKDFSSGKKIIGQLSSAKANSFSTLEHQLHFTAIGTRASGLTNMIRVVIHNILQELVEVVKDFFGKPYFLPASRTGLYTGMNALTPIISEFSKQRVHVSRKIELPSLSAPIADYIINLSELDTKPSKNKEFLSIVRSLEQNVLKGDINFDDDKKQLYYRPEGAELNLSMNAVSSMVSGLSPLVAFVKFILGKNGKALLFIEEPEAHLHPEAQVQLAEILVKLMKAGVKLLITSHSNYIFHKLSNMVIAGDLPLERYAPIVLKDTGKGSVGKLMAADELGVEDENFIDTADALYEERELILETLNDALDDQ